MVAHEPPRSRLPRAERELQVLDAARALFAARGFRDVTMDAVAAAVGVTKPLLYNYFGNKEQLYLACVRRTGEELEQAVSAAVAAAPTPGEALKAALRTFFAFVERDRGAWQVLYDESLPTAGPIAEAMDGYRARIAAPVAGAFAGLGGSAVQAEALAHGQLAAAEAMSRWWLATDALPARELAELLIDTLEPGLAQRATAPAPEEGTP
ncbi:MAG: transcriptional regulator, TetR family [Solirubrobacterales bacterium]|jgi:AcrR family transcriptional regulator|nr:transcriptional regulator, TetR family [Solirubrobacterales bacterium]